MFTKRSTSGFFMVLAIFNLIFAVAPPIAGAVGVYKMMQDSDIIVNGRQVGPEFDKEVAKEAPLAKIESFAALAGNSFAFLLIVIGSAGLFMGYGWGRWAAVVGALVMIFSLLVHDVYQIFFYRPALMTVVELRSYSLITGSTSALMHSVTLGARRVTISFTLISCAGFR